MDRKYNATEVSNLVGITPEGIKNWERMGYIPQAARVGLRHTRIWAGWKVDMILEYARSIGYTIKGD